MEDRIRAGVQTAEIRHDGRTIRDLTTRMVYDSLEEFQVKVLRSRHTINMYDFNHPEVRLHGQCIEDHSHLAPIQVVSQGAVVGDPLVGVHGAPRWAPILTVQAMRRTRTGYAFLMVVAIIMILVHSADGAAVAPINSRYTSPSPIGWGSPPMETHGSVVISQMIAGIVVITLIYRLMLENNGKPVGRDTLRLIGLILNRKRDTPAEHGGGADNDDDNNMEQQMMDVDKLLLQQARLRSIDEDIRRTSSAPSTATPDIDIEEQQLMDELTAPAVSWQSELDLPQRRKMITKIVSLLQQRKPNAPNDWVEKLPEIARRLEDSLYRTASSAEEYDNFNTLKHRLQQLALSMGTRAAKKSASGPEISNEVSIDISNNISDDISNGVSNDVDKGSKPFNYRCRFSEDIRRDFNRNVSHPQQRAGPSRSPPSAVTSNIDDEADAGDDATNLVLEVTVLDGDTVVSNKEMEMRNVFGSPSPGPCEDDHASTLLSVSMDDVKSTDAGKGHGGSVTASGGSILPSKRGLGSAVDRGRREYCATCATS
jgi:hypothetical protein